MHRARLPSDDPRHMTDELTVHGVKIEAAPSEFNPLEWLDDALRSLDEHGLRRRLRTRTGAQQSITELDGRSQINFGSNDYLGLAADPRIGTAAQRAIEADGWGAGASPLISGHTVAHRQLATDLADFEGTAAALVFTSGFAANTGTIAALVDQQDAVFADAKNHASLIDGCRLSRANVHVYRHADVNHLQSLLETAPTARRRLIVTDSLFSMDGDLAPLVEIAELRRHYDCMLMVDEAHATGVFGDRGKGVAEQFGVEESIDVKVGTLSKALGCAGGFVTGSDALIQWLINRTRPYVFSTAHPAATAVAASMAVRLVREEPERRQALLQRSTWLRDQLTAQGWDIGTSTSQIIPLIVRDAALAVKLSTQLSDQGFFIPAIRPPSVPPDESLLRLSITFDHSEDMLQQLVDALRSLRSLT